MRARSCSVSVIAVSLALAAASPALAQSSPRFAVTTNAGVTHEGTVALADLYFLSPWGWLRVPTGEVRRVELPAAPARHVLHLEQHRFVGRLWLPNGRLDLTTATGVQRLPLADLSAIEQLRPAVGAFNERATIPLAGRVKRFLVHPTRPVIYAHDATNSDVLELDAGTHLVTRRLSLPGGSESMALSRDGARLFMGVSFGHGYYGAPDAGRLVTVDTASLTVASDVPLPIDPWDLATDDQGQLFVSGGSNQWTEVLVWDPASHQQLARLDGPYHASWLRLVGDRLYYSTESLSPQDVDAFDLGLGLGNVMRYDSPYHGELGFVGEFEVAPDARHLFCRSGAVLVLSPNQSDDLVIVARLPDAWEGIAFTADEVIYSTAAGDLVRCSRRDFRELGRHRLSNDRRAYRLVVDPTGRHLFAAVRTPPPGGWPSYGSIAGPGDIVVLELPGPGAP